MEVKLFVKDACPACDAAAIACRGISNLSVFDLGDLEGALAASTYGVRSVPSVLIVDSSGREIAGWRGQAPDPSDLRAVLAN